MELSRNSLDSCFIQWMYGFGTSFFTCSAHSASSRVGNTLIRHIGLQLRRVAHFKAGSDNKDSANDFFTIEPILVDLCKVGATAGS